jgi:hypothetical protein
VAAQQLDDDQVTSAPRAHFRKFDFDRGVKDREAAALSRPRCSRRYRDEVVDANGLARTQNRRDGIAFDRRTLPRKV